MCGDIDVNMRWNRKDRMNKRDTRPSHSHELSMTEFMQAVFREGIPCARADLQNLLYNIKYLPKYFKKWTDMSEQEKKGKQEW